MPVYPTGKNAEGSGMLCGTGMSRRQTLSGGREML